MGWTWPKQAAGKGDGGDHVADAQHGRTLEAGGGLVALAHGGANSGPVAGPWAEQAKGGAFTQRWASRCLGPGCGGRWPEIQQARQPSSAMVRWVLLTAPTADYA